MKKKEMIIWFIQVRQDELNKISLGASDTTLKDARKEFFLNQQIIYSINNEFNDKPFTSDEEMLIHMKDVYNKQLQLSKDQLIAHINNNHKPQSIDLENFQRWIDLNSILQQFFKKAQIPESIEDV